MRLTSVVLVVKSAAVFYPLKLKTNKRRAVGMSEFEFPLRVLSDLGVSAVHY
jgi:hypothetical protein